MPPSAVDDSARAMMARLAEWRDDTSGLLQTGGGPTAYTLSTFAAAGGNAYPNPPARGTMIATEINTTNGASPTLSVDGGSAYPIHSFVGTPIGAAALLAGSFYEFVFNDSLSCWAVRNFFGNSFVTPIGGLIPYVGTSVPNANFAFPNGQAISRTTYATLFSLTGTTFGPGDGSTTFNIPDLRGRTIFGLDNGAGRITVAGGNIDGTVLGNAGGGQNQTLTTAQLPAVSVTPSFTGSPTTPSFTGNAVTPTFTGINQAWTLNQNVIQLVGGPTQMSAGTGIVYNNAAASVNVTPSGTISSITPTGLISAVTPSGSVSAVAFGSGNSHTILPPAMVLPYILRII